MINLRVLALCPKFGTMIVHNQFTWQGRKDQRGACCSHWQHTESGLQTVFRGLGWNSCSQPAAATTAQCHGGLLARHPRLPPFNPARHQLPVVSFV